MQDQIAGVENAGPENAGPKDYRTGKWRTNSQKMIMECN